MSTTKSYKERNRAYSKKRYHKLRDAGLCTRCGKKEVTIHRQCPACMRLQAARIRSHYQRNKAIYLERGRARQKKNKEEGRCSHCSTPLIEGEGVKCSNCLENLFIQGESYAKYYQKNP